MAMNLSFGALLKKYRQSAGLTQEDLAERSGLSVPSISNMERQVTHVPRAETIRLLIAALGLAEEDASALFTAATQLASSKHTPLSASDFQMPFPLTPLIGREQEVAEIFRLIHSPDVRLLTISGAPGVGKTRVGLAVGANRENTFERIVFLDLSPLRDPELILPTIAQSLNLSEVSKIPIWELLQRHLQQQHFLFILDNFEHLLAGATKISKLLEHCPTIKMLVTSRVALRVKGEIVYPVAPFAVPSVTHDESLDVIESIPAVAFFLYHTRAFRPDMTLTRENAPIITTICQQLDGIPLALELAAQRVRIFSFADIAKRLEQRLVLLTQGARDGAARQQTLRGTLDWSYLLLPSTAQAIFRRLAVFAGGGTIEAANAICGVDTIEEISLLLDHHLVQREEVPPPDHSRITMLETIREYAWDQLRENGEADEVQRQHATFYADLAQQAEPNLQGNEQGIWLDRLAKEEHNLSRALLWGVDHSQNLFNLHVVKALLWYWYTRNELSTARYWQERVLTLASQDDISPFAGLYSTVLNGAGAIAQKQGDYERASWCWQSALVIRRQAGNKAGIAGVLNNLGIIAQEQCHYAQARDCFQEALALAREANDQRIMGTMINNLGNVALEQGAFAEAHNHWQKYLDMTREAGDTRSTGIVLFNLAAVGCLQGEYRLAQQVSQESLSLFTQIGDQWGIAKAQSFLAEIARDCGEPLDAEVRYLQALETFQTLEHPREQASVMRGLGATKRDQHLYDEAISWYEQSLRLRRSMGQIRGVAMALTGLGQISCDQGNLAEAVDHFREALPLVYDIGDVWGIAHVLEGVARIFFHQSQPETAVYFFNTAHHVRRRLGSPLPPSDEIRYQPIRDWVPTTANNETQVHVDIQSLDYPAFQDLLMEVVTALPELVNTITTQETTS